jgi:GNAT superfamily N-acetyltransferase
MPKIEIRTAMKSDLPALSSLSHAYETPYVWQMDRSIEDDQMTLKFREIRLPRMLKVEYPYPFNTLIEEWDQSVYVMIALLGGVPVAYLRIKDKQLPGTAWVTDLVVRPQQRRQGIASGLIIAAQDWGAHNNFHRMIVEMQSKNYPAICLAKKLGFEFCGYHDHYYLNRDIALFFSCSLHGI